MSALEQAVQPILSPMITDGLHTVLDQERQALISTWVMKTTMSFEHQSTRPLYYTAAERLELMARSAIPEGVCIWAGRYVGSLCERFGGARRILGAVTEPHAVRRCCSRGCSRSSMADAAPPRWSSRYVASD